MPDLTKVPPYSWPPYFSRNELDLEKLIDIIRDQSIRISELEENVRNLSNRLSILEDNDIPLL